MFAVQRDVLGRARVLSVQAMLEARGLGYKQLSEPDRLLEATDLADQAVQIANDLRSQIDRAGALQSRATVWQRRMRLNPLDAAKKAGAKPTSVCMASGVTQVRSTMSRPGSATTGAGRHR
jgi:hypothetical protein